MTVREGFKKKLTFVKNSYSFRSKQQLILFRLIQLEILEIIHICVGETQDNMVGHQTISHSEKSRIAECVFIKDAFIKKGNFSG